MDPHGVPGLIVVRSSLDANEAPMAVEQDQLTGARLPVMFNGETMDTISVLPGFSIWEIRGAGDLQFGPLRKGTARSDKIAVDAGLVTAVSVHLRARFRMLSWKVNKPLIERIGSTELDATKSLEHTVSTLLGLAGSDLRRPFSWFGDAAPSESFAPRDIGSDRWWRVRRSALSDYEDSFRCFVRHGTGCGCQW